MALEWLPSLINGIASIASTGAGAGATASQNKKTREMTRELNATNIAQAKENRDMAYDYAREDREWNANWNSEQSQYARLLSIGLSPAAARAALSNSTGSFSQLGSIDTSTPETQGYTQTPYDFSGLAAGGSSIGTLLAQQQAQQQTIDQNDKFHAEEMEMRQKELEFQQEQADKQALVDEFGRKEVEEQTPKVQDLYQRIRTYAREKDFSLENKSIEEIEHFLDVNNKELLNDFDELCKNACAARLLEVRFERAAARDNQSNQNRLLVAQTALADIQKSLGELSEEQIRQELKYYPVLQEAALRLQRITANKTQQELNDLVEAAEDRAYTRQDRREAEKEEAQMRKELARYQREREGYKNSTSNSPFQRAIYGWTKHMGLVLENVGSFLSLLKL